MMTLLINYFHLQVEVTVARDASGTHKFLILQLSDVLILNLVGGISVAVGTRVVEGALLVTLK